MTVTRQPAVAEIAEHARRIRIADLEMIVATGQGHLGSDFSAIDILATLYCGGVLRIDPRDPMHPDRDRFILSKGHSAGGLYCALACAGLIESDELASFMAPLSRLNGHPDRKVPGVETNTGPLGHGLPVGVGVAKAARITGRDYRTYVLSGDGELQEGSMWEAAMFAGHHGLDNLTLIVDRNRLQQGARTEELNRLDPLGERFTSFGWSVTEVDGNSIKELLDVFSRLPLAAGKPSCVIANTNKGSGVSFMSDNVAWHHKVPNTEEYERALAELGVAHDG
jgi:transketolase